MKKTAKIITRNFGGYKVKVKRGDLTKIGEGEYMSVIEIIGDIEIGIEIDNMTWREDWLRNILFGEGASIRDYRIVSINNQISSREDGEHNVVTSVWKIDVK